MSKELERRELMRWSGQSEQQLTTAQRFAGWIDSKLSVVAPQWAANRMAARAGMAAFSAHRAASTDRLMGNWLPVSSSADAEIYREQKLIRARASDLERNNPIAHGVAQSVTMHSIASGIKVQSHINYERIGISESKASELSKMMEWDFRLWCEKYCDATGRMTFGELQYLIFHNVYVRGEILVQLLRINEPGRPFDLALELIESDRLETPYHLMSDATIRNGVKLDGYGRPVQYFIRKTHPGDIFLPYRQADVMEYLTPMAKNSLGQPNLLHLFFQDRPGQNRGISRLAPVIELFESLDSLYEARLVRARVAACFTAFITKSDPISAFGQLQANQKGERLANMQPGRIEYLATGEDVKFSNAQASNTGEDAFVREGMRAIAAAVGMPYEMVARAYNESNYSSIKAAFHEARQFFRAHQRFMYNHFVRPCWEVFQQEQAMRGALRVDLFGPHKDDYLRTKPNFPGFGLIDPNKEVEASGKAIAYGLTCHSDEVGAITGRDYEEVCDDLAREARIRKERDLPDPSLPSVGRPAIPDAPSSKVSKKPINQEDGDVNADDESEDGGE